MAALPWPYATISGAISGIFSGFFGIGGAIMTVPAMTMFFGLTQLGAQGMALAFAVPSTILTTATYALAADVDWANAYAIAHIQDITARKHGVAWLSEPSPSATLLRGVDAVMSRAQR